MTDNSENKDFGGEGFAWDEDNWGSYVDSRDPDLQKYGYHTTGWTILVKPLVPNRATSGGILLPETTREDVHYLVNVGKVLQMGERCYTPEEDYGKPWCRIGDWIAWRRFDGDKVKLDGVPCVKLKDTVVRGRMKDPSVLSALYNIAHRE